MFFNQLFQAECLREDVIFVSSSKSMTKSTAKRIEIITKLVELVRRTNKNVNKNTLYVFFLLYHDIYLRHRRTSDIHL